MLTDSDISAIYEQWIKCCRSRLAPGVPRPVSSTWGYYTAQAIVAVYGHDHSRFPSLAPGFKVIVRRHVDDRFEDEHHDALLVWAVFRLMEGIVG